MRNKIEFKYRKIRATGTIEVERAQKRAVLRDEHQNILGYFYIEKNETHDAKHHSVGLGNLLSGLLLIAAADAKRETRLPGI